MGSQTLEILRQGVWASLTGGWFYDPRLDVFSNTFHLYVWLFLLCLPFTIYLYFPPTLYVWLAYCSSIVALFGTIKCVNHALHCIYDTTKYFEEPDQSKKERVAHNKCREQSQDQVDNGIELQVLNGKTDTPPVECSSRNSFVEPNAQHADADSITSEYNRDKPTSTMDLKVEIHRKNSSESSEGAEQLNMVANVSGHEADIYSAKYNEQRFRNVGKEWKSNRQKCVVISEADEERPGPRTLRLHASEHSRSRHPKQSSLGKTGSESQIKQTSSLELEHHGSLELEPQDYSNCKSIQSVRRFDSSCMPMAYLINDHPQSLEIISKKEDPEKNKISSHPQSLEVINKKPHQQLVHPQSLETIGATSKSVNTTDDNNLPLHPQSLETINTKKGLPQNPLKRNQLQLLPYLSYGSEIVHPIAEQSDEQFANESSGGFSLRDSYSPQLTWKAANKRDRILSSGRYDDKFSRFNGDGGIDNDSANSRDALLEEPKTSAKSRYSNASQSSHEFSDEDRRKERADRSKATDDPLTTGSIVGIDLLFESSDCAVEPWTSKNAHDKDAESGSSSATTLSIDNEIKSMLHPQLEMDTKKHQGAIPKQSRPKPAIDAIDCSIVSREQISRMRLKGVIDVSMEKRHRRLQQTSCSNNELGTLLPSCVPSYAPRYTISADMSELRHPKRTWRACNERRLGRSRRDGNCMLLAAGMPDSALQPPGFVAAAQLPSTTREKLHLDGRRELTDSLCNSCSSLSSNSDGLTVIIDTPSGLSSPSSSHTKAQTSQPPKLVSSNPSSSNQCAAEIFERAQFNPVVIPCSDSMESRSTRLQTLLDIVCTLRASETDTNTMLPWNRFDCLDDAEDKSKWRSSRRRHYYKWKIGRLPHVKVRFDRLSLLALLDRNLTLFETIISTLLAVVVAGLGLLLLQQGLYRDIFAFIFCFVTAGCQYSLLKSVQPDAASPTHGFNRIILFSRPVYYILCTGFILIVNETLRHFKPSEFRVYGMRVADYDVILQIRNVLLVFLLCFPVVFSLGLFPQINTFLMYLCEHTDIHIFGGNATTSLVSSIYCLGRSIITVLILYGFAYGALTEPKSSQHILFSIFLGLLVAISYHLSRSSSDPTVLWNIFKSNLWPPEIYTEEKEAKIIESNSHPQENTSTRTGTKIKVSAKKKEVKIKVDELLSNGELVDPLPEKLKSTVNARLKNDLIVCAVIGTVSFGIHCSTVFTALQPELNPVLWGIASCLGFLLHYIVPQLRKHLPWLCLSRPVLRNQEHAQFEVFQPVKIMWFEKAYVCLCFLERNILYPVVFLGAVTECSSKIVSKFGESIGALIIVVCGLKSLRSAYSDPSSRYLVLVFSVLFFKLDFRDLSETFLVDYFVTGIAFAKIYELLLKIRFIVTYIAPWQITWGSAFHAFAQPFSVPHSAMLFLQAGISAVLSTPLNPLLGSAIFISSYVRPVKFWERDYKTRRVDHSNTRMSSHLDRNLADDNNLNSIFYEQLTRSLQHSLYGDLALGRWGNVEQGDCFLLASDYLNCLVHIVQLGNGLVTFQLRGLEFRGTYCQQREVEAISEDIANNDNCCCCKIGHFSNVLSIKAAFNQRCLAWEVASAQYVLEGYSISENPAVSMLQVFEFRKMLVTYYVKSIIFYAIKSPKLKCWLEDTYMSEVLKTLDKNFVDLDPVFNMNIDEDFDFRASGITRSSFCNVYMDWIRYCAKMQDKTIERRRESPLVSLCLALSLLGRRVLGTASRNAVSSVEYFLYGLHALFKGDVRITCVHDEWVLRDVDLLHNVVAKGVRMALKLHQDHFMSLEDYVDPSVLYTAIDDHDKNLVISHEADPLWRNAVLSGAPSLLALRHALDDGIDDYKVIMLNKRYLSFRVIKMNRECVRALWAGQQQELVYLRNRNPERGSIQNAKQALRNIINSSCDQPIGYPIYVSPLTTSYAETNDQLCSIIGGPLSFGVIKTTVLKLWKRIRRRCGEGCSSGGTVSQDDGGFGNEAVYAMTTYNILSGHNTSDSQSIDSGCQIGGPTGRGSLGRANTGSLGGNRGSLASMGKPTSSTLANLAGLLNSSDMKTETKSETSFSNKTEKEEVFQRVRIMDPNQVYDAINLGRRIDVIWPDERMRQQGGRSGWQHWVPERGMEGCVVHRWSPSHRDPNRRSHVDKVILLVKIDDKYVPIAEQGVRDLGAEV